MIDVLEIDQVLSDATLERIRREMRAAPGEAATVTGAAPRRSVAPTARRTTQVTTGRPR